MDGSAEKTLPAGLYVVSTPIGAARDITLRALDVLRSADVIAAEDTRTTRRLMEIHGIPLGGRRLVPYHDHNGPAQRPKLLAALKEGRSVAYVSDAGTPLVADPGFGLARAAIAEGHEVLAVPGPSALLAALVVSGLPSDRFLFAGFLPPQKSAREAALSELAAVPATLVFYESPKRLSQMLSSCVGILGGDRDAAVCRELTKRFEEVRRGSLDDLATAYEGQVPKGEIVVLIGRGSEEVRQEDVEMALQEALRTMTVKDAAREVAGRLGLPRRDVYQMALGLDRAVEP